MENRGAELRFGSKRSSQSTNNQQKFSLSKDIQLGVAGLENVLLPSDLA